MIFLSLVSFFINHIIAVFSRTAKQNGRPIYETWFSDISPVVAKQAYPESVFSRSEVGFSSVGVSERTWNPRP